MTNILSILLICFGYLLFTSQVVLACKCVSMPSIYESFIEADKVFIGKPISFKDTSLTSRVYRFQVKDNLKNNELKEIDINTSITMCSHGFTVGEDYLVYANKNKYRDGFDAELFCSRTTYLESAKDQIFFINEYLEGKTEHQIYGTVELGFNPIQNIKVILTNKKDTFETITDKNGIFYFDHIPKGEYWLTPSPPNKYKNNYPETEYVEINQVANQINYAINSHYNAFYTKFRLNWNNKVTGNIKDIEGNIINNVSVAILPINKKFKSYNPDIRRNGLYEGKFNLSGREPGKYYLVAELNAPFNNKNREIYYFGAKNLQENPAVIKIGETDELTYDWILPVKQKNIKGSIFWDDGKPIDGNVKILLTKSENPDESEKEYDFARLNKDGNFLLNGFEGAEYWLQIYVEVDKITGGKKTQVRLRNKPIKIKVKNINEPLKILIPKPDNLADSN